MDSDSHDATPSAATATAETVAPPRRAPLNRPVMLSHGTITCRDLAASRRFYEEFLGLDVVQHTERGIMLRKGGYCAIVCLEVGDHVKPVDRQHHWGIDLATREEVDRALELAHRHKDEYGISQISRITTHHGGYSFYFRDLDDNYWEFQYVGIGQDRGEGKYDRYFARGDVNIKNKFDEDL